MLLDPETLDLVPRAEELLARLGGDARFKPELPAAQVEIVTPPCADVAAAVSTLAAGRRDLAAAADGIAAPAVAGAHPFAAARGQLSELPRYDDIRAEYGDVARRQLVSSLQVHVPVGAARTLPVYNALRGYLPELAALAANAPFHEGEDTGLASVRPKICELLPRQGVPPAFGGWDELAAAFEWGAASAAVTEPRLWWWELRPHVVLGTLEVRVPDAQTTVADAGAVIAVTHALAAWLAERHDGGEPLPAAPTWRIEENRWSAARHGLDGTMADLLTGEREPTRERLARLLGAIDATARRLGSATYLEHARSLAAENGALRLRASGDAHAAARHITRCFLDSEPG